MMWKRLNSLWETIKDIVCNISVEPCVFAFAFSYGLYSIVAAELYIQKVCRVNLALGDICENIQDHKEEQIIVQKYVSKLRIYNSILQVNDSHL